MQILLRALAVRDYVSGDHYKRIEERQQLWQTEGAENNHLTISAYLRNSETLAKSQFGINLI